MAGDSSAASRPVVKRRAVDAPATGLLPLHPTHYERLGVPDDADAALIEAAWSRHWQPGAVPPPPLAPSLQLPGVPHTPTLEAAALRLAYAVLSDPGRRAVYDAWLAREQGARQAVRQRQHWWRRPGARRLTALALGFASLLGTLAWLVWGAHQP